MQIIPYVISLALLAFVSNTYVTPGEEMLPASQMAQATLEPTVQSAPTGGTGSAAQEPAATQPLPISPAPQIIPAPRIEPAPQIAPMPQTAPALPIGGGQFQPSPTSPGGGGEGGGQIQPPPTSSGGGGEGSGQGQPRPPRQLPQPQEELQMRPEEEPQEQPVDPREVLQVRKEIKQMLSELKRFSRTLKRMPNNSDDLAQIDAISTQVNAFGEKLANTSQSDLRDIINEFREGNYWDQIQKIRAKVEIPNELSRIEKDIKKIRKLLTQAAYKTLGVNVDALGARLDESTGVINKVREAINSGDLDEANEEMRFFHEGGQPGEIMGVLTQLRDITSRLKSIKDKDIKSQIQNILNEIIAAVNSGDFREARETMGEYADDLMRIVAQASKIGRNTRGTAGNQVRGAIGNLENLVKQKLNAEQGQQNGAPKQNVAPFNPFR